MEEKWAVYQADPTAFFTQSTPTTNPNNTSSLFGSNDVSAASRTNGYRSKGGRKGPSFA
jgi:hypothetical protein